MDPDQLASEKPADLDPNCFQKQHTCMVRIKKHNLAIIKFTQIKIYL